MEGLSFAFGLVLWAMKIVVYLFLAVLTARLLMELVKYRNLAHYRAQGVHCVYYFFWGLGKVFLPLYHPKSKNDMFYGTKDLLFKKRRMEKFFNCNKTLI